MRVKVLILLTLLSLLSVGIVTVHAQPPRDMDNDGVIDVRDRCPTVPGPASNDGCPLPGGGGDDDGLVPRANEGDVDGDGVPNAFDRCPNQGGPADNAGCQPGSEPPDESEEPQPAPIILPNLPPPGEGRCVAATEGAFFVNARAAPSLDAPVIASLNPTLTYPVLFIVDGGPDDVWYLLPPGFASASVMRLGGNCDIIPVIHVGSSQTLTIGANQTEPVGDSAQAGEIEILSWSWGETNDSALIKLKPVYITSYQLGVLDNDEVGIGVGELAPDEVAIGVGELAPDEVAIGVGELAPDEVAIGVGELAPDASLDYFGNSSDPQAVLAALLLPAVQAAREAASQGQNPEDIVAEIDPELAALLLPAVQAAREAANRASGDGSVHPDDFAAALQGFETALLLPYVNGLHEAIGPMEPGGPINFFQVAGDDTSPADDGSIPTETLSLNFEKINFDYDPDAPFIIGMIPSPPPSTPQEDDVIVDPFGLVTMFSMGGIQSFDNPLGHLAINGNSCFGVVQPNNNNTDPGTVQTEMVSMNLSGDTGLGCPMQFGIIDGTSHVLTLFNTDPLSGDAFPFMAMDTNATIILGEWVSDDPEQKVTPFFAICFNGACLLMEEEQKHSLPDVSS